MGFSNETWCCNVVPVSHAVFFFLHISPEVLTIHVFSPLFLLPLLQNRSTCRSWWLAPFLWRLWSLARWWPCTVVHVCGPNSQRSNRSAFPCVASRVRPSPWFWLQGRGLRTCEHHRVSPAQPLPAPAVVVGAAHCAASLWADLMLWDSSSPHSSSCWPQPHPFPHQCPWHQLSPYCLLHLHLHTHLHIACRAASLTCTRTNTAIIRASIRPRAPTFSCPSSTSSPCSQRRLVGVKDLLISARADLELRVVEQDTGADVNMWNTVCISSMSWNMHWCLVLTLEKSRHALSPHTSTHRGFGWSWRAAETGRHETGTLPQRKAQRIFWLELFLLEKAHRNLFAPLNKLYSIYALLLHLIWIFLPLWMCDKDNGQATLKEKMSELFWTTWLLLNELGLTKPGIKIIFLTIREKIKRRVCTSVCVCYRVRSNYVVENQGSGLSMFFARAEMYILEHMFAQRKSSY